VSDARRDEIDVHVGKVEALEHAEPRHVEVILLHQEQTKEDQGRHKLIGEGRQLAEKKRLA